MKTQNQQPTLKTLEDVNAALASIAALTVLKQKLEASMNDKILAVKKEFETDIDNYNDKIELYEEQLSSFGKANKKMFKDKRSTDLIYGRIGFRAGKKALRLIKPKSFTWDYVKEKLQDLFGTKFVKVKTIIKKTEVLNAFEKGSITEQVLEYIGVKVTQGEEFFYKINWDEIKIDNIEK